MQPGECTGTLCHGIHYIHQENSAARLGFLQTGNEAHQATLLVCCSDVHSLSVSSHNLERIPHVELHSQQPYPKLVGMVPGYKCKLGMNLVTHMKKVRMWELAINLVVEYELRFPTTRYDFVRQ